ncbi:MAG: acyl-CoA dehydrogenase [Ilumatobacter sp.]|uniref:acyl-CoA dehydrogenase n=1 Tax=Ilumatobacter sp. TaxID=1967498 RepID=UPI00260DF253|nr:acyl-CoA dehydrogenase [Ilumatobacter sp.]MDJ0768187.1 acyl-CoA dehydrogenase [Ilumatobacter sp.]
MSDYSPPLSDIRFVMDHVADLESIVGTDRFGHVDAETIHDVLAEVGRFMAEVVAPTNRDGDTIGATWHPDGSVTLPDSFKPAYHKWVESGFGAMPFDPDYGGAGFPWITAIGVQEMLTSANMAFSLCPLLTQGAIDAIHAHGSDDQRATYLPKMLTGEWTGTMNLTEPHAGSDVGAVTTKAVAAADASERWGEGAWRITGQKIFITWGEHDVADNILHLVLARTPGSPPGTKGISMFLVPKFLVEADGSIGERNTATCVSIEHKLGIHGSPTCVMSFEDAIGWLVGGEHEGMRNMFTMMNNARLSVGLQGLSITERAYQQSLQYSLDRQQGRAVGAPAGTSSPIIDHPDVRRMLMTQRAWIDAMRCLVYSNAGALDRADAARAAGDAEEARSWQELADLLIPLSKSLSTDVADEMTSIAVQVHGGMGYVEETGVAQHYRDARIAPIYEGTNGIQAADLVGRKLGMRSGGVVVDLLDEFEGRAKQLHDIDGLGAFGERLTEAVEAARTATSHLVATASSDPRSLLGASVPYLRLLGTTVCGGLLAKAALAASNGVGGDAGFLAAKVVSAKFFGEQILPTAVGLLPAVLAPADDLYALSADQLAGT